WQELAKELEDEGSGGGEPEPQTDPELKAEPEQESKADAEPPKDKPEHVPYQQYENMQKALKEEREARRQYAEQLHSITQLIQQLRESRQQPKQEPQEEIKQPSLEEDPIGYFQAELAKRDKIIEELKTGVTQKVEKTQAQLEEQQFWNTVIRSEQEIRLKVPDYDEATS